MFLNSFRGLLIITACLLLVGCESKSGQAPVAGHLTRGGKPCEGVTVNFVADDMMSQSFVSTSRADGSFDMFSMKGTKGVLPGAYSVQITVPLDAPGGAMVPGNLQGPKSPWRVSVTDKGIADLQLDMDKEKLE